MHNIRVVPEGIDVPDGAPDLTPRRGPPVIERGVSSARAMPLAATLGQGAEEVDEADEEAERQGFFGEQRRAVKVGERTSSVRQTPVPPSTQSAVRPHSGRHACVLALA